jgi:hypothetical protein
MLAAHKILDIVFHVILAHTKQAEIRGLHVIHVGLGLKRTLQKQTALHVELESTKTTQTQSYVSPVKTALLAFFVKDARQPRVVDGAPPVHLACLRTLQALGLARVVVRD